MTFCCNYKRRNNMSEFYVYPNSMRPHGCGKAYMLRDGEGVDWFVNCGVTMPLDHKTAEFLRREFPWTAPSRVLSLRKTIGLGDRTSLAADAFFRVFKGKDAVPVPVQHSGRDETLTGFSFEEMLDAATFAAYREGYMEPWGADASHIQSFEQIETALAAGYTMISVDCAGLLDMGGEPGEDVLELYLGRTFSVEGMSITYDRMALDDCCRLLGQVLALAAEIYESYVRTGNIDFVLSLEGMKTPTTPAQHYFLANELLRRGIVVQAIAPVFNGVFQQGQDYDGDTAQFEAELKIHSAIARAFGYKLCLNHMEDKTSLLQTVSQYTKGTLHLRTEGLSWIEAIRLIAQKDASLYKIVYSMAMTAWPMAQEYFHANAALQTLPEPGSVKDALLPTLFGRPALRSLISLTYPQLIRSQLREKLFAFWKKNAEDYFTLVQAPLADLLLRLE